MAVSVGVGLGVPAGAGVGMGVAAGTPVAVAVAVLVGVGVGGRMGARQELLFVPASRCADASARSAPRDERDVAFAPV